jgi:hypothetical protein
MTATLDTFVDEQIVAAENPPDALMMDRSATGPKLLIHDMSDRFANAGDETGRAFN